MMMRERSVRLQRCDLANESCARHESGVSQEIYIKTHTSVPSYAFKDGQDEDVIIKKEDTELGVKQELDIGPTILQPRATAHSYWPHGEAHLSVLHPNTSSGGIATTTPAALDEICGQSTLQIKEEDYNYEDNYKEFVASKSTLVPSTNIVDYAGKMALREQTYKSMETSMKDYCMYCLKLSENEHKIEISNSAANICISERNHKCKYCGHKRSRKLRKCLNSHAVKKSYKCHLCEYSGSRLDQLKIHVRRHTGEKPFKCNQCEYSAYTLSSLQGHTRRHTGEKPFKCMQCEYSGSHLSSLRNHMSRHSSDKPCKCKYCEYSTSLPSSLQRHTRRHTGEKPHKCQHCDYSASILQNLRMHERKHAGVVISRLRSCKYNCEHCKYSTFIKSDLRRHMYRHMDIKPFSCKLCKYSALESVSLQRHMGVHGVEKPFKCAHCVYSSFVKYDLRRHLRMHIGEKQ